MLTRFLVFLMLILVLAGAIMIALAYGPFPLGWEDVVRAVKRLSGDDMGAVTSGEIVFMRVRLPRVAADILVGAALSSAGSAYQTLFRNPLVSPDILGVATGSGLGAVVGILMSLSVLGIEAFAFLGGIATVLLVYLISSSLRGHDRTLVLVLSGVVVGAFAGACISLVKVLSDPNDQLPAITFWLLGSPRGNKALRSRHCRAAGPARFRAARPAPLADRRIVARR
jgi:iron complex transport system permease protein